MKVLVACEESQEVTKAFRAKGHEAYSCDIQECSGGHPEWHILGDATLEVNEGWDIVIAHPPCTYLSNAGARFMYPKGILSQERLQKAEWGKKLFMAMLNASAPKVCVENPIPCGVIGLPPYSQVIQPYYFGDPYQKKTCLWLKGLQPLMYWGDTPKPESTKVPGNWFNKGGKERQKNRSKTFPGIAKAMAEQWG